MKNLLCSLLTLCFVLITNAQVGVNNTAPKALLDISVDDSDNPKTNEGILIPRVNRFPTTNPIAEQNAMLVYLNANLTNVNINGTAKDYAIGFYYWDNAQTDWINFSTERGWNINGNNDAVSGTHFLGTTNQEELDFRVNNKFIARLTEQGQFELQADEKAIFIGFEAGENYDPANTTAEQDIFIGYQSGKATTSGRDNVAIGTLSLTKNTSGNFNTAVGDETLENNTTGIRNTAIGNDALRINVFGNDNTGIGQDALRNNRASRNIAIGAFAGNAIQTGVDNLSIGSFSNVLFTGVTGAVIVGARAKAQRDNSIAIGTDTETYGIYAVGIGAEARSQNTESIALGYKANSNSDGALVIGANSTVEGGSSFSSVVGNNSTISGGSQNVNAIGNSVTVSNGASNAITIGNKNTLGGGATNVIALGDEITIDNGRSNAVGIGYQASPTASNQIRLGNNLITEVTTSGTIKANSFIATGTNTTYADYVFEDYFKGYSNIKTDYKFNTLESAEAFVKKHGHLPGVKSYKEVMLNGFKLDLTESTITNLEKIEEQFLYITELKSELKAQLKTIETQNEKIKTLESRLKRIEALLDR